MTIATHDIGGMLGVNYRQKRFFGGRLLVQDITTRPTIIDNEFWKGDGWSGVFARSDRLGF